MKFAIGITKGILVILLISFLFNVFHDFVFYNFDPCLKDVKEAVKFDMGKSNDLFCELHHSLHSPYTIQSQVYVTNLPILEDKKPCCQKISLDDIPQEIFKPPIYN